MAISPVNIGAERVFGYTQDEFLAMLAHELRNPLSAISNAVQIVKRPDASDHHPWASGVIETHVVHLARMIDELLDVSRITRGKIKLKKEEVDMTRVIGSAVETARPFMEEQKHQLDVAIDPGPILMTGDPTRLWSRFLSISSTMPQNTPSPAAGFSFPPARKATR